MHIKKLPLLVHVLIAIAMGVVCSYFFPVWLSRVFMTFNSLFGNFLSFIIPLLILALVAPGIAELGAGAGKMLGITALIAYGSTVLSGLLSYGTGLTVFPSMIGGVSLSVPDSGNGMDLSPYFTIEMPVVLDIMSALILAFILGVGLSLVNESKLIVIVKEFREVIMKVIIDIIIPCLPLFIFGIFLKNALEGNIMLILLSFLKVIVVIFLISVAVLILQFCAAGAVSGKNPFKALWTMLPAYLTALGTQSSAATIPVTLERAKRNGVSDSVADFVVPLCATIHMSGSCLKITGCALAISMMCGMPYGPDMYVGFIMMLGITMVAAPGVPGGAIMAALGLLSSMLGFDEQMQGLMMALYITMDSFGTATNVTGDGAIAMIMDRIHKRKTGGNQF